MNYLMLVLPIISGICSWLISEVIVYFIFNPINKKNIAGFTIQGLIPSEKNTILEGLIKETSAIASLDNINSSFVQPTQLDKVIHFVEPHVDHFLRIKLSEKMPVISMFIGEKTITDLKLVFMEELVILFPKVIEQYLEELQASSTIQNTIAEKLNDKWFDEICISLPVKLSKEIKLLKFTFLIVGFIVGLIQLAFTLIII